MQVTFNLVHRDDCSRVTQWKLVHSSHRCHPEHVGESSQGSISDEYAAAPLFSLSSIMHHAQCNMKEKVVNCHFAREAPFDTYSNAHDGGAIFRPE